MMSFALFATTLTSCALQSLAQSLAPKPLIVEPSAFWDGLDGPWSTFYVGIGQPLQAFRCVPGLNSPVTLLPIRCNLGDTNSTNLAETCQRRASFRYEDSASWATAGVTSIPLPFFDPSNTPTGALWGVDTFWLGTDTTRSPRLSQTFLLGVTDPTLFVPVLGLTVGEFGHTDSMQPTILSGLRNSGQIPSASFGYTAGSYRRSIAGSLVLGGYDAAHLDGETTLSVRMTSSINASMIVGVTAVRISNYTRNTTWSPSWFVIDSTMPQIWMPTDACRMFEEAFRLTWDTNLEVYTINDTTHDLLLQENPTVTFTISATLQDEGTVNYTLPYSAFDLTLAPPLVDTQTYYFPLRRSPNGINLLGRAFLQEVYIVVDFERGNFSISQAIAASTRDIVPIYNTTFTPSQDNSAPAQHKEPDRVSLSTGAYAGVAIGAVIALVFIVALILAWKRGWWFFRKKPSEQARFDKAELHDDAKPRVEAMEKERAELPVSEQSLEIAGTQPPSEVEGIHDMHELHGEGRADVT